MNGAIIGFGQAARHGHWPAYAGSHELSIVAVVDRTEERRRLAASLDPALRTYASLEELAAAGAIDLSTSARHRRIRADARRARAQLASSARKPFVLDAAQLAAARACAAAEARGLAVVPVRN
jgi:predicted dehydrogenase